MGLALPDKCVNLDRPFSLLNNRKTVVAAAAMIMTHTYRALARSQA